MKTVIAALFALAVSASLSRAELVLDNIANTTSNGLASLWKAQSFITSAGSWWLTQADLWLINSATNVSVSIYDNSVANKPGSLVATLAGPTTITGNGTGAAYSFTSSGIALSGGTRYWLVQTAASGGNLSWRGTTNANSTTGSWSVPAISAASSSDGTSWNSQALTLNFTLYASSTAPAAVPEPGTWAAALLVGGVALLYRRKSRAID
ncbi:MAG: choice-of-anchor R domain-containing protein [Chthoniobacterales bacterium]|jgi:hypothetical protein